MGVGLALLGCVQQILPDLSSEAAVLLDFECTLPEEENLAVQCILITGLKYIWEARLAKKVVSKYRNTQKNEISKLSNTCGWPDKCVELKLWI